MILGPRCRLEWTIRCEGLYATHAGVLGTVLAVGDFLAGQEVVDLDLGAHARDGNAIAFWAELKDGTTGIDLAKL